MDYFISVLGLALVLEGLPWFISPERLKSFLASLADMPVSRIRFVGIFSIVAGLMILCVARIMRN